MPYAATPYTISASNQGKPRKATRNNASSAMCLADDWAEKGSSDIWITDVNGVVRSPEDFGIR